MKKSFKIAVMLVGIASLVWLSATGADGRSSKVSGPTRSCDNVSLDSDQGGRVGQSKTWVASDNSSPGFQDVAVSVNAHKLQPNTYRVGLADLNVSNGVIIGCSIGWTSPDTVVTNGRLRVSGTTQLFSGEHFVRVFIVANNNLGTVWASEPFWLNVN